MPSRAKLMAHIGSILFFGLVLLMWVLPGSASTWVFVAVFVVAFVIGPITSGHWRPSRKAAPKLAFKPNDRPAVRATPAPTDTKAFAKQIGLDG